LPGLRVLAKIVDREKDAVSDWQMSRKYKWLR